MLKATCPFFFCELILHVLCPFLVELWLYGKNVRPLLFFSSLFLIETLLPAMFFRPASEGALPEVRYALKVKDCGRYPGYKRICHKL